MVYRCLLRKRIKIILLCNSLVPNDNEGPGTTTTTLPVIILVILQVAGRNKDRISKIGDPTIWWVILCWNYFINKLSCCTSNLFSFAYSPVKMSHSARNFAQSSIRIVFNGLLPQHKSHSASAANGRLVQHCHLDCTKIPVDTAIWSLCDDQTQEWAHRNHRDRCKYLFFSTKRRGLHEFELSFLSLHNFWLMTYFALLLLLDSLRDPLIDCEFSHPL